MARAVAFLLFLLCLASLGCNPTGRRLRDSGLPDGAPVADEDGDTISDSHEGRGDGRDTDGDGTPDFRDDDSDNDGILDAIEAGDADAGTPPVDSDSDLTPDFNDEDSDNNSILDLDETDGDLDGDGRANFRDTDDDGDFINDITEIAGMLDPPLDNDRDGLANFQDPDSDNDFILDGHERDVDTDHDGSLDLFDTDSDEDGLSDAQEAGDRDLHTPPVDTDGDTIMDFRDRDSDNDGLADGDEVAIHGTSPTNDDSDGDMVSDLIEIGAGTDPNNGSDSPRTRGDFVFVVPYMEPPDPDRDTLTFRTSIQKADIYFLFDRSGSMDGEIAGLKAAVNTLLLDLTCADSGIACMRDNECTGGQVCNRFSNTCTEDPATTTCVPSIYSGAGWYVDTNTLVNTLSLQPLPSVTASTGLNFVACGPCSEERLYDAIEGVANPAGVTGESGCSGPRTGFVGCPSFRQDAVRMLVAFTDEDSDGGVLSEAANALINNDITLVGVWSGDPTSTWRDSLVQIVRSSNSYRADGTTPLVYDGMNSAVVPALTTAINEIVDGVPLRVTIAATDEGGDAGDALQFISQLVTNTSSTGCSNIATADANPVDGVHETFPAVRPGLPVCWDVVPAQNDTVMPELTPLVFKAKLTVYGDGSPLDSRYVYFLVPPYIPEPIGPG